MDPAMQVALAVGPLAAYFATLGALQVGRRPVFLPGQVDFTLLALGLGGPIVFGPVGQLLVHRLFPAPSPWAWMALVSLYGLAVLLITPRAARRLVVYNIDPEALRSALRDALLIVPGSFEARVRGFEDEARGCGLTVEVGRFRVGSIEAYGRDAAALIREFDPVLRQRLAAAGPTPTKALGSVAWFALAALVIAVPFTSLIVDRPVVFEAVRAWIEGLGR